MFYQKSDSTKTQNAERGAKVRLLFEKSAEKFSFFNQRSNFTES